MQKAEEKMANDDTLIDIIAPSAGESVTEAEIGAWHVGVGDAVNVDDPLVELETDKAAMDVPAQEAGRRGRARHDAPQPGGPDRTRGRPGRNGRPDPRLTPGKAPREQGARALTRLSILSSFPLL